MSHCDFYHTWAAQKKASFVEIISTEGFSYKIKGQSQEIIDLSSLSFQASFGLRNISLQKAIVRQYESFPCADPKMVWREKEEVARKLKSLIGRKGKIFFCLSGAEAIENALKMARDFTGRKTIAARTKSYHGATLGAISISGDWRHDIPLTTDCWVLRLPASEDDPEACKTRKVIEDYGPQKIAAICLETVAGANGVVIPPNSYWEGIQSICLDYEILLILDEVITGLGRTGKKMGFHHFPIEPDFVCMAKGLTGGFFPMGAVWTHKKIADYYEDHILCSGLTNYAHPVGLAAISFICSLLEGHSFQQNLNQFIFSFHQGLEVLTTFKGVREIRKIGMLAAIETSPFLPPLSWSEALPFGFSAVFRPNMMILAPALTMPFSLLEEGLIRARNYLETLS